MAVHQGSEKDKGYTWGVTNRGKRKCELTKKEIYVLYTE